jgi:SOS-response transcriptional repressor LexA
MAGRNQKPRWATRIRALRGTVKQIPFAKKLGTTQQMVSLWEAGSHEPSAEYYIRMGNLADYPDCLWFWEKGKLDLKKTREVSGKQAREEGAAPVPGEVVRVRPLPEFAPNERMLPLPANLIPNPSSTFWLRVSDPRFAFLDGEDLAVIDSSCTDATALWGKMVIALREGQILAGWLFPADFEGRRLAQLSPSKSLIPLEAFTDAVGIPNKYAAPFKRKILSSSFVDAQMREGSVTLFEPGNPDCRILGRVICWLAIDKQAGEAKR